MIECDVIRDLMPLYAEGLASEATRRVVETHTVCCPGCRSQLEAMCAPLEPDAAEENKNYIQAIAGLVGLYGDQLLRGDDRFYSHGRK